MVDGKKVNKSFVFISLMFLILLMSSFVLAQETKVTGKFEAIVDFVPGVSAGIERLSGASGESIVFTRLMLIALVVLIVYSVSEKLPFLGGKNDYIRWAISAIVGVLSFLIVDADTIRAILTNYQAFGVMLTTIIPLFLVGVITMELRKHSILGKYFGNFLVIGFMLYVLTLWYGFEGESSLIWVYPVTLILALLWLIFGGRLLKAAKIEEAMETTERAGRRIGKAIGTIDQLAEAGEDLGDQEKAAQQRDSGKDFEVASP